jgi:hypothetical protein
MAAGDHIDLSTLASFDASRTWWFDEDYLGKKIDALIDYIEKCRQYATILRGLGQAHVRRCWVRDNGALDASSRALLSLNDIIASGEIYSA